MPVNVLSDVEVEAISIVTKGANRKRFFMRKARGKRDLIELPSPQKIAKAEDWSAVYCVVAEPGWLEDAGLHGDQAVPDRWLDEDEIRKTAHRFMKRGGLINLLHKSLEPHGDLVENAIALSDFEVNGETIRKGSWYIAFEPNMATRGQIESGEFGGVSIQGSGTRTLVDKTWRPNLHPRDSHGRFTETLGGGSSNGDGGSSNGEGGSSAPSVRRPSPGGSPSRARPPARRKRKRRSGSKPGKAKNFGPERAKGDLNIAPGAKVSIAELEDEIDATIEAVENEYDLPAQLRTKGTGFERLLEWIERLRSWFDDKTKRLWVSGVSRVDIDKAHKATVHLGEKPGDEVAELPGSIQHTLHYMAHTLQEHGPEIAQHVVGGFAKAKRFDEEKHPRKGGKFAPKAGGFGDTSATASYGVKGKRKDKADVTEDQRRSRTLRTAANLLLSQGYSGNMGQALRDFQRKHGLKETGEADPETMDALRQAQGKKRERAAKPDPAERSPKEVNAEIEETKRKRGRKRKRGTAKAKPKAKVEKRSLARSPKENWIERLPKPMQEAFERSWLHRAAVHLVDKGMSVGHAIATGINAAKKGCATGDLNWPGLQQVNPGSKAEMCASIALWESMKAASGSISKGGDEETAESVEAVFVKLGEQPEEIWTEALAKLDWNPGDHPRDWRGRFVEAFGSAALDFPGAEGVMREVARALPSSKRRKFRQREPAFEAARSKRRKERRERNKPVGTFVNATSLDTAMDSARNRTMQRSDGSTFHPVVFERTMDADYSAYNGPKPGEDPDAVALIIDPEPLNRTTLGPSQIVGVVRHNVQPSQNIDQYDASLDEPGYHLGGEISEPAPLPGRRSAEALPQREGGADTDSIHTSPVSNVEHLGGGVSTTYTADLDDGGRVVLKAPLMKEMRGGIDEERGAYHAVAASHVAEFLGLRTPEVAARDAEDLGVGEFEDEYGDRFDLEHDPYGDPYPTPYSVQEWIDGFYDGDPSGATDESAQAMTVLDYLIGNTDRHEGNWGTADGELVVADMDLVFPTGQVDWGNVTEWVDSKGVITGRPLPDALVERLRTMQAGRAEWQVTLERDGLTSEEIDTFWERFDNLIGAKEFLSPADFMDDTQTWTEETPDANYGGGDDWEGAGETPQDWEPGDSGSSADWQAIALKPEDLGEPLLG